MLSYATVRRDLAIGSTSICLSICLSHTGNASKLITVGSCGFHHRVARDSVLLRPTCVPQVPGKHPELQTRLGYVKPEKNVDFWPINQSYVRNDRRQGYSYNGRLMGIGTRAFNWWFWWSRMTLNKCNMPIYQISLPSKTHEIKLNENTLVLSAAKRQSWVGILQWCAAHV